MIRPFFASIGVWASCAFLIAASPSPAAAQAKASAEASAAKRTDPHWKAPRNAWGQPDLEGIWTTDDMRGVPMSRPEQFGTRAYMTDEEFAARAKQRDTARNIDDARTGTFRNEEGTRSFGYTSLVIDPPDGRVPAVTPAALARRAPGDQGSFGLGPWSKIEDFSLYDRCITRGVVGSFMPAVYGNGARIIQTPNAVVIGYEMVHDTASFHSTAGRTSAEPSTNSWETRAGDGRETRLWSSRGTTPIGRLSAGRSTPRRCA